MANRYQHTKRKKSDLIRGMKDPNVYRIHRNLTTIYSSIPETDDDIYVITQEGDRLDLLANQFYGDVGLWWYIAKANKLTLMTLDAGITLRIPATTQYAIGK